MDDSERQKINASVVEAFYFRARERKVNPGADRIYEAIRERVARERQEGLPSGS